MQETVEEGAGERAVVVEGAGPVLVGFVCGDDGAAALVSPAGDLKKVVGSVLVDGQVAEFVQDQELDVDVAFEFLVEPGFASRFF